MPYKAAQVAEQPPYLVAREDDGQPRRRLRPNEAVYPRETPAKYHPVEKQDGAQCLVLGRSRHASR
jgi:hypothetical protein